METLKEKTVDKLHCPCHLCERTEFDDYDENGTCDFYNMNGTAVCMHDLKNCKEPTIFCPFLDMWRSMWFPCCCTSHQDPKDCEINGDKLCLCPRCCEECNKRFWPQKESSEPKCCQVDCHCHLKTRLFTSCRHLRGFCEK